MRYAPPAGGERAAHPRALDAGEHMHVKVGFAVGGHWPVSRADLARATG